MFKHLAVAAIFVLTLVAGAAVADASSYRSATTDFDFGGETVSDDIETGLCIGASLDISRASEKNCKRKQRTLEQQGPFPYDKPNIEASLCAGVSLNLSRASAARCAAKTSPSSSGQTSPRKKTYTYARVDERPAVQSFQYAALGDSIAAGAGLPESTNRGDAACDRSTKAYAYYVAAKHEYDFIHVACSGTTMGDLLTRQSSTMAAQLDSAFTAGTPLLITITAGANNTRWSAMLLKCLRGTCGTASDNRVMQTTLTTLKSETQDVLDDIAERSDGSPPNVIMTGYYNPLSENCSTVDSRLSSEEVAWASNQVASLNQTLQNAVADASFATFVPIDFTGHDICSSNPWVQNTNSAAPLHPTVAGQQAIAQAILANF